MLEKLFFLLALSASCLTACNEGKAPAPLKIKASPTADVKAEVPKPSTDQEAAAKGLDPLPEVEAGNLRSQALAFLDRSCASCHNANNAQGNFGTIENVEDMIAGQRYIVPGAPEKSLLFTRLAPAGNMPPSGKIKAEEVALIKNWIAAIQPVSNKPLSDAQTLALIRRDVDANVAVGQRSSTRYLSLHVPNNLGAQQDSLNSFRQAMLKVVNSISRSPALVKPEAIDPQRLIFRLKLDEMGISPALFDAVMKDFYPYSQNFVPVGQEATAKRAADDHSFLKEELAIENYLLRMDWFVATAPLPQLYNRLLELGADQSILDAQLGVNTAQNVVDSKVLRSGFKNSNVSTQNRIIERHAQRNGLAYWISYDFVSNENVGNIFSLPLGPVGIGFDARAFQHDGGEIIFQLPNGMLAFYLSNAQGAAIDKGPTSIVKQNDAPAQFLTAIVNGFSCMSCHQQGLIAKKDEIRPFFVANSAGLRNAELSKVFDLYPEDAAFADAMKRDNAIYLKAMKEIGLDPVKPDPVNQSFRYYNRALTKTDIIEELGITAPAMNTLLTIEPFRSQWTSLQASGGFIKRDEFNALLGLALEQIKANVEVLEPAIGDLVFTPSCMFADPLKTDICLVRKAAPAPVDPAAPAPAPVQSASLK